MNRKLLLPLLVVLSILCWMACNGPKQESRLGSEDVIPVKLLSLKQSGQQAGGGVIHASGLFTTDDETVLSFRNGGEVNHILVKEGDVVRKGQLLASVNATDINAGVQQAVLAFEKAGRDYNRAKQLYLDSVATQEQMQNAQTAMEVARQQLNAARSNQQYSEIRASTSGFVLQRFVNEGQVVGPGAPVLQINGAQKGDWLINAGVSDRQWAQIKVGDPAIVETDALPGQQLKATVFRKAEGVDPNSGTLNVQLKLSGAIPAAVASGIFAKAAISVDGHTNVWTIPVDALLDGDGGKGFVFTTNDNKTAKKTEVQIGEIRTNVVLITGGLENVSSVIISGSPYLSDGSKIEVR